MPHYGPEVSSTPRTCSITGKYFLLSLPPPTPACSSLERDMVLRSPGWLRRDWAVEGFECDSLVFEVSIQEEIISDIPSYKWHPLII